MAVTRRVSSSSAVETDDSSAAGSIDRSCLSGASRNTTPVIDGPRRRLLPSSSVLAGDTGWLTDSLPSVARRPLPSVFHVEAARPPWRHRRRPPRLAAAPGGGQGAAGGRGA